MANFNSYIDDIDMSFWHQLCAEYGTVHRLRKGESLTVLRGGSRHLKYVGIVLRGYFKYTVTDSNGNECITGFSFSGTLVGDFISIIENTSASTNITAGIDTEAILCPVAIIRRELCSQPQIRRTMAEALFKQAYATYINLHRHTPTERYKELLIRYPDILQKIPLKEMASYLQITPTHLSRIRKQLTFNKGGGNSIFEQSLII
ncbi:MAG: Crp/Fnr family transcriptional regulator [Clostridium sp.]|nr:Crp/Fnr family transcriptional regulator [Clostridium sp.]